MIEKNFIRIWLGNKELPDEFEEWWQQFKALHPDYNFITLNDDHNLPMPSAIQKIYDNANSYAGRADILRIIALKEFGGIYVDTDVMPIKSFDSLVTEDNRPFAGKRSTKSFEIAVLGSPKNHIVLSDTLDALPEWYKTHSTRSCSVATGPAFVSSVWFGREDVRHLPIKTFYPFNGFRAPKRHEKEIMFLDKSNFPDEMICAHFSNSRWGGKPKNNNFETKDIKND